MSHDTLGAAALAPSSQRGDRVYSFGPFRLFPAQQLLLNGDLPVRLGSRALEILAMLIERAGELVSKEELIARVWPDTCVEESNLKVQISALRRVFNKGSESYQFIATSNGRGYRFVAAVEQVRADKPRTPESPGKARPAHNLPALTARTIGRESTINALTEQLLQHRLVTVVGAGGIGKTTVAVGVAERLLGHYNDGIWFVDLAPGRDPQFVPSAATSALGLTADSNEPVTALVAYLRQRRVLIVLDSCEHLIAAVAEFAERLVSGARYVHVLATSRQCLRAPGERVYRLAPLETPPVSRTLTPADAGGYSAIELFVERATGSIGHFKLEESNAPAVAEICRKLEGIPLAIELAATRMDAFSPRELLGLLDDRLDLLTQNVRSALTRHQTLAAALDWSYDLLSDTEKTVLRRLSAFAGPFSIESASAVAADDDISGATVIQALASLVSKSLVCARSLAGATHYGLLNTTRAYAFDKLTGSGALNAVLRRHAVHHREIFERAEDQRQPQPTNEWLTEYSRKIDDVRNALAWAFSDKGDVQEGISLTVSAIPLWMHLSLMDECGARVKHALTFKGRIQFPRGMQDEMKLCCAVGAATMYGRGLAEDTEDAWTQTLTLARKLADHHYEQRALWGLTVFHLYKGNNRRALQTAKAFHDTADGRTDPTMLLSVDRLTATALHYLGQQARARELLERMLGQFAAHACGPHIGRFHLDQRAAALGTLATVLWLSGYPQDAVLTGRRALEAALERRHAPSLINTLVDAAFPTALLAGDEQTAATYVAMSREYLRSHPMPMWNALVDCIEGSLRIHHRDPGGVPQMHSGIEQLRETRFELRIPRYLGVLASGLTALGQYERAHGIADEALALSQSREPWCFGTLLQVKADVYRAEGSPVATRLAEQHLVSAVDWACTHQVPGVELPAATRLARLWQETGEHERAHEVLSSAFDKFTQGFDTVDLRNARSLLEDLTLRLHRSDDHVKTEVTAGITRPGIGRTDGRRPPTIG